MKRLGTCVVLALLAIVSVSAQTYRGSIQGAIRNDFGKPISKAVVTVRNVDTGLSRSETTGETGTYFISELPIGGYEVSVKQPQFASKTVRGIQVVVSSAQTADFQLESLAEAQAEAKLASLMQVSMERPVQTPTDNLGGKLDSTEINLLPIDNGYLFNLTLILPGVSVDPAGNSDGAGGFAIFSINGVRGRGNSYLLDGTDANDAFRNLPITNYPGLIFGVAANILPLGAVQEVSVLSQTQAEYGRSAGATVETVTKSGTNSLHGTAYEHFRNDGLDARNYFNPASLPQNVFHEDQFGFSAGGPIVRDKAFFFGAYEGQRGNFEFPSVDRIPTAAQIAQATADNGNVVNTVIASLLARNPWGTLGTSNTLLASDPANFRNNSVIAKIDRQFASSDVFTARYFYANGFQDLPGGISTVGTLPGFNTSSSNLNTNILSVSYVHSLNSHWLSEIRGGYTRFSFSLRAQDSNFDHLPSGWTPVLPPRTSDFRRSLSPTIKAFHLRL